MQLGLGRGASRVAVLSYSRLALVLTAVYATVLAGCTQDGKPTFAAAPRGATVAFESIDGPPPAQFHTLVQNLNDEAQIRRLAVISREAPSAYRVRGYLAAKVAKGQTRIAWVWDVFDGDERRAFRIDGEETAKVRYRDAWSAADDAMLRRIARSSMEQLAAFLTSSDVAPGTASPPAEPAALVVGQRDTSPEGAGIFRIFQANADPVPAETAAAPAEIADPVPLPRRRPAPDAAVSARETPTLTASLAH